MVAKYAMVAVVAHVAVGAIAHSAYGQQQVELGSGDVKEGGVPTGRAKPPPLNVDYWQFGIALHMLFVTDPGPVCPVDAATPCILGQGAGIAARAGYRSRGPLYVGGHYSLVKLDTQGLMRMGLLQQIHGEFRYLVNLGQQIEPYLTSGVGGVVFGDEWSVDTWGLAGSAGVGIELQLSRTMVVGMAASYRPILFFAWTDHGGQQRNTGVSHFWGLSFMFEAREALGIHEARR